MRAKILVSSLKRKPIFFLFIIFFHFCSLQCNLQVDIVISLFPTRPVLSLVFLSLLLWFRTNVVFVNAIHNQGLLLYFLLGPSSVFFIFSFLHHSTFCFSLHLNLQTSISFSSSLRIFLSFHLFLSLKPLQFVFSFFHSQRPSKNFFSIKVRLCLLLSIKFVEAILDSIFKLYIIFPSSYPSTLSHLHFDYKIIDLFFLHLYIFPFKYHHCATHKLCILMFLQFKLYFPYLIFTIEFQNTRLETRCINIYCVYVQDKLVEDNLQLKMAEITPTK